MKSKVAIAAPSLIRTKEEEKIVIETISNLNLLNIPIIITDGGSPKKAKSKIKKLSNVTLYEAKGLTNQLFTSFKQAQKIAENIFYLHTDKLDFSKNIARDMINKFEFQKKTIFIPTRTKESFSTYPVFQQEIENFLNLFISDYIGIKNDYYFGPKIFPSSLVKHLDQVNIDLGWGIEAFFYVLAKRLKLNFEFYTCFVNAPKDLGSVDEIKRYRLKIVSDQISGFSLGLEVKF